MQFSWGHEGRYNDYSHYIRSVIPGRTQKISINAGFNCPNRDGTKGYGGCTYCNNDSFTPEYCHTPKSVMQQIEEGKLFFQKQRRKRQPDQFLAYFQAYSNTYGNVQHLDELFTGVLSIPQIAGLVVATRPDCIDAEKLDLLEHIARKYYVAVEYGVESCNDATLKRINRCHTFEETRNAIFLTADRGIDIGAHLILGLPGEQKGMILSQAAQLSELPIDILKLHQLQVLKSTRLAKEFTDRPQEFSFSNLEEYVEMVCAFLSRLRPEIVIERFASQAPPQMIVYPHWGMKNYEITNKIVHQLAYHGLWQGKYYNPA